MGSLYRKYRSRSLAEIVGQEHITELLARNIAAGAVSHAYLLTGPHGVGKTSIARILAHEINGLTYSDDTEHLDIIEIDAASNNGVEDIRELRERVHIAPAHASKKIYIIDEVHMLSKSAFNALLKTLEEPPEHVVFILATTEADKLPSTIISRVQRFNFRSIRQDDIVKHLRHIADSEKIAVDQEALERIAEYGQGSFRDSIGILDQLRYASAEDRAITVSDIETILGITSNETIEVLLTASRSGDIAQLTNAIAALEASGVQANLVTKQLIRRVQSEITTHPTELSLLDALLDVPGSAYPYLKLLTVLAGSSAGVISQFSGAALASHDDSPKASLQSAELASAQTSSTGQEAFGKSSGDHESTKKLRHNTASADKTSTIGNTMSLGTSFSEGSAFPAEPGTRTVVTSGPGVPEEKDGTKVSGNSDETTKKTSTKPLITNFSWPDFLAAAKEQSAALHALLAKTGADFATDKLTLYAGTAFAAKKLETPKLRQVISEIALAQGIDSDRIVISADKKPPSDSQAASVAAIMGGGEEVEIHGN